MGISSFNWECGENNPNALSVRITEPFCLMTSNTVTQQPACGANRRVSASKGETGFLKGCSAVQLPAELSSL